MDLQEIGDKINLLLSGDQYEIIFWCDKDAEYTEEIDNNGTILDE